MRRLMSYCIITKATIASFNQIYDIGHEYCYDVGIQPQSILFANILLRWMLLDFSLSHKLVDGAKWQQSLHFTAPKNEHQRAKLLLRYLLAENNLKGIDF